MIKEICIDIILITATIGFIAMVVAFIAALIKVLKEGGPD